MHKLSAFMMIMITFAALPVYAQDMAAQKQAMLAGSRQETVALGSGRFLIFSGSKAAYQYVYSIDLVEITGDVPHYDPLFIEEFDPATDKVTLSNGVAFGAESYHFDNPSETFSYTSIDAGNGPRLAYTYKLIGDTLMLEQVLAQGKSGAPVVVYKATDHAKKN